MAAPWNDRAHTYIPVPALAVVANPDGLAEQPVSIRAIISHVQKLRGPRAESLVSKMRHRRRKVFIDTHKGRVSAGFTVAAEADAADVSMRLRERGWIAYRLRLEAEQYAWVATVIDWTRRAA
jgi:hypothetical protein